MLERFGCIHFFFGECSANIWLYEEVTPVFYEAYTPQPTLTALHMHVENKWRILQVTGGFDLGTCLAAENSSSTELSYHAIHGRHQMGTNPSSLSFSVGISSTVLLQADILGSCLSLLASLFYYLWQKII